MISITENGHAKNVAIFGDLISFCTSFGETYNPSKPKLKLPALNTQLTTAMAALQALNKAKIAYDHATDAREIAFKPLKPLAIRIMNAISSTDVAPQTIDDARTLVQKIQGRRSSQKKITEAESHIRTFSVSQHSFDKMIDHYGQLVSLLGAESNYLPNEADLKVASLRSLIADLREKDTNVINAQSALSHARIALDRALYGNNTGVLDVAQAVKLYLKSLFGLQSPEFRQVRQLSFSRIGRD